MIGLSSKMFQTARKRPPRRESNKSNQIAPFCEYLTCLIRLNTNIRGVAKNWINLKQIALNESLCHQQFPSSLGAPGRRGGVTSLSNRGADQFFQFVCFASLFGWFVLFIYHFFLLLFVFVCLFVCVCLSCFCFVCLFACLCVCLFVFLFYLFVCLCIFVFVYLCLCLFVCLVGLVGWWVCLFVCLFVSCVCVFV